jgi:hypothetical protein
MPESPATSKSPFDGCRASIAGSKSRTPRRAAFLPALFEAKKDYTVVGFGHVSTDVTETLIHGEKASPGLARRVGYERIGAALQSFVCDGIHEVTQTAKIVSRLYGQVLVDSCRCRARFDIFARIFDIIVTAN